VTESGNCIDYPAPAASRNLAESDDLPVRRFPPSRAVNIGQWPAALGRSGTRKLDWHFVTCMDGVNAADSGVAAAPAYDRSATHSGI
jgi:hypothetical protein